MIVALTLTLLAASRLSEMTPCEVDDYLCNLEHNGASFQARLVQVAKDALGTPYADGPLGEGPKGTHDQDPLMDLAHVDCVTYIEQCIALAASTSYAEAFQKLQRIRYEDGQIDYESRNHFMVADWITNNAFCKDVTKKLKVETATVSRTISRKDFFQLVKAPELGQDTPDNDIELTYVPVDEVAQAEPNLPSPAIVVFVGKIDWLFALHCGLYVREPEGEGRLYHASSKAGEVVAVGLTDYLRDTDRYLGFTAYAVNAPE